MAQTKGKARAKPTPFRKARARQERKRATKEVAVAVDPIELPENRRDVTALQRNRVEELFSHDDRRLAVRMIGEGYFGEAPTAETTSAAYLQFVESCRRTVNNHRRALLKTWDELPEIELGDKVATREFVARMRSLAGEVRDDMSAGMKSTAKMSGYQELRQLETLAAKALGVDIDWKRFGKSEDPDDSQSELPFVGLLVDLEKVSPEVRAEIQREQKRREQRGRGAARATQANPKIQIQR